MKIFHAVGVLIFVLSASAAFGSIELVSNGNFNAGNSGFSSGYKFVASPTTSTTPGDYAIRSLSTSFNPGYSVFTDHTGDVGGLMMLVDGLTHTAPNLTIAWTETVTVTPNTTYNFSAWGASSSPSPNQPTLQFFIGSTQLGSDLLLPPSPPTSADWQQFNQSWNSGANTSAQLIIYDLNATPFQSGNDFALDDISFTGPDPTGGAVPEPASLIAWGGLVLIGIAALRASHPSLPCARS